MSITVKYVEVPPKGLKLVDTEPGQLFYFRGDRHREVYLRASYNRYILVRSGHSADINEAADAYVLLLKGALTVEELE